MSTNANALNPSAPEVAGIDGGLLGVVDVLRTAAPGVVKSIMIVADVLDGVVSGVVLDDAEPGGGYVAEQELAQGVTYLILGVGKLGVGNMPAGIHVVEVKEAAP